MEKYLINKKSYILHGGSKMNIFNLSKSHYKQGNLQNNLEEFRKKYVKNSKCKIKYKSLILDMTFREGKNVQGITFYQLIYDVPNRSSGLYPMKIDFIDPLIIEKNNNTYISNIHKTDKISGSNMVKICLEINKRLGAVKTTLGDGTNIKCNDYKMDLSFIKLIEKKTTFYMNLGFKFEIKSTPYFYYKFNKLDDLIKEVNNIVDHIRKIKISEIILECKKVLNLITQIITSNYKYKVEIYLSNSTPYEKNYYLKESPLSKLNEIYNYYKSILDILHSNIKLKYFYKLLIKMFKDNNCSNYKILNDYMFDETYMIKYGNKRIIRKNCDIYAFLNIYRSWYLYSYYF